MSLHAASCKSAPARGPRLCNNIVQFHCFSIALRQYQRYRQLQRTARQSTLAHEQLSTYLHQPAPANKRWAAARASNEEFEARTLHKLQETRSTPAAQSQLRQPASARNSTEKTLYLPPPCLQKIARAGLPYFIQAEKKEAIWAPDARHQSGEGNQGSHNAGFTMI